MIKFDLVIFNCSQIGNGSNSNSSVPKKPSGWMTFLVVLELDVFPFLDILSYAVFVQFVLKLSVAVEVDNEGRQIDEIAVTFDLEFELLFDGSADSLSLDSTDLGRL